VPLHLIGSSIVPSSLVTSGSGLPHLLWSSGCAGLASLGCPAAASSSSSGCAPAQASLRPKFPWSPGCPRWCALQLCRRSVGELPRVPHPSAWPLPEPQVAPLPGCSSLASPCFRTGCPGVYTFRLFRRWRFGSPRAFHPFSATVRRVLRVAPLPRSACRASWRFRRVAPVSAPSGCASDGVPGLPRYSHPSALPVQQTAGCPAAPLFQPRLLRLPPGCPGFRILWRCRGGRLQVALNPVSLSVAASASLGLPLGPALAAGSMMNPCQARTLHPQLAPRMNLRVQSGLARPRLTLDAASILFGRLTTGRTGHKPTPSKLLHASRCQTGTAFPCRNINLLLFRV